MRKYMGVAVIITLILSFLLIGCEKKEASSKEAIMSAETMQASVQKKADYLIGQAKAFYNSREYQQAVDVAQYVLSKLDKNSQEAKNLLEKAKNQLAASAKKAASDAQKKLGGFGK